MMKYMIAFKLIDMYMIKCCSGCALSAYNGWRLEGLLIKSLVTEALSFNINLKLSKGKH